MKIAILGFGVEGQDAARYFLQKGDEIVVFDKKEPEEIETASFPEIQWKLGGNYLSEGLEGFDLIVRSPGVYRFQEALINAEKSGVKITSNTQIFLEEVKVPVIGITGTKGKGTTSTLITKGLEAAGKSVVLGGNIGEPMLALIDKANASDYAVLELSSFQTIDLAKSPHIAVLTNLTSDHMDWHKDLEEYEKAKEQLWAHQKENDFVVLNWQDKTSRRISKNVKSRIVWFSNAKTEDALSHTNPIWTNDEVEYLEMIVDEKVIGRSTELKIPGQHNVANALAALCVIKLLGEDVEKGWHGMTSFEGLEHRLEKVADINGVLYINDSYATNPEPTKAALLSYPNPKILIAGGSEKNADFTELGKDIASMNVKALLLIGVTAGRIEEAARNAGYEKTIEKDFQDMPSVVQRAHRLAEEGEIVILSPACASFGMFENYKDRGKKFKQAVKDLNDNRGS